ncbi:MAG: hypothetical protein Q4D26_07660 [Clostridia bacterium]|nr:hypothetical protein [Clostridia bacterium]
MKFRCKKTLTIGRFQIFEDCEARLKHITYDEAPESAVFTLFFKTDGFSLDIPQSVLISHFEPIMDSE